MLSSQDTKNINVWEPLSLQNISVVKLNNCTDKLILKSVVAVKDANIEEGARGPPPPKWSSNPEPRVIKCLLCVRQERFKIKKENQHILPGASTAFIPTLLWVFNVSRSLECFPMPKLTNKTWVVHFLYVWLSKSSTSSPFFLSYTFSRLF